MMAFAVKLHKQLAMSVYAIACREIKKGES